VTDVPSPSPRPSSSRVVLRGTVWTLAGALIGAAIGLLAFVPGELLATAGSSEGAHVAWPLALGVGAVCARAGAVAGLIAFFLKRSLLGETADPMAQATRPGEARRPEPPAR
jgi:hypothetical protein